MAQPLLFSQENLPALEFQPYQKVTLTRARQLTAADVLSFGGIIPTLEGPVSFQAGDYLGVGVAGELWPMSRQIFESTKLAITEPDSAGFRDYATIGTIRAAQIPQPFAVRLASGSLIQGKAGDYLAYSDTAALWIVDRQIFNQTYKLL